MAQTRHLRSGLSTDAYLGVNAPNPPSFVSDNRDPTVNDFVTFFVGDLWLNRTTEDVFVMVATNLRTFGTWALINTLVGVATSLRADDGIIRNPLAGEIRIQGQNVITTTAAGNTVTISTTQSADGRLIVASSVGPAIWVDVFEGPGIDITPGPNSLAIAIDHFADLLIGINANAGGIALPDATQVINLVGNEAIRTITTPNTVTLNLTRGNDGEVLIGSSVGPAAWALLDHDANIGIAVHHNSITISSNAAPTMVTFNADVDTASPVAGFINFLGGDNINTAGDGVQTMTVNLNQSIVLPDTTATGQGLFTLGTTPFVSNYLGNVYFGGAGNMPATGVNNVLVGDRDGSAITSGSFNTGIGDQALFTVTSGTYNQGYGDLAAAVYTTEHGNISINHDGVAADDHVLRIGNKDDGNQSLIQTFIDGIYQAPVDYSTIEVVINDAVDKLGSISMSDLRNLIPVSGTVLKVSGNSYNTCILLSDGSVWCTGQGTYGALGVGDYANRGYFTKMVGEGASGCTDVECAVQTTYVSKSGKLYATGTNAYGRLGIGDPNTSLTVNQLTPMIGHGTAGCTALSASYIHLLVLKGDAVYSVGCNMGAFTNRGQLGIGSMTDYVTQLTPMVGFGSYGCNAISAGAGHSLVLRGDAVYGTGENFAAAAGGPAGSYMGIGTQTPRYWTQLQLLVGQATSGVDAIHAGSSNSFIIKAGKLYGAGSNGGVFTLGGLSVLGDGTNIDRLNWSAAIGAGMAGCTKVVNYGFWTHVLKGDAIYGTGWNHNSYLGGWIGDGTHADRTQFTAAINNGSNGVVDLTWGTCILRNDGLPYFTGDSAGSFGTYGRGLVSVVTSEYIPTIQTW